MKTLLGAGALSMTKPLYLVDGSNLAFRAHCAYPGLSIQLGDEASYPMGATYGTIRILDTMFREWEAGKVIMPFDISRSVYRLGLYPEYKAGRHDNKQKQLYGEYAKQLDLIIDLLGRCGVTTISGEATGYEADDVLAYIVSRFRAGAFPNITRVVLITSDKDLCALVGPNVVWYDPIRHNMVTHENFQEQFGVTVEQYPDFKALKGDQSDNIKGVPGIGPKRAAELLTEYGSIDRLLEISHQRIAPHREAVELCRKLVGLRLHEIEPESPIWSAVSARLRELPKIADDLYDVLTALQFESVLAEWVEWKARWQRFSECSL